MPTYPFQFGDAADARHIPTAFAALYDSTCDHPCPPEIAAKWPTENKRWITFTGNRNASIIDYERFTSDFDHPLELRAWLAARRLSPTKREPFIYSDLSNAASAKFYADGLPFKWWIATLDGIRFTQLEVVDMLRQHGVKALPDDVAGNQWIDHGTWDQSTCFGHWG